MKIIILLLSISTCLALIFLIAFIWAQKTGQYSDSETPSMRILFDNKKTTKTDHGAGKV